MYYVISHNTDKSCFSPKSVAFDAPNKAIIKEINPTDAPRPVTFGLLEKTREIYYLQPNVTEIETSISEI